MKEKIRILFYNLDSAGVNYFRTQTPAIELERQFSDEFHVEINPQIDFNDPDIIDYLKSFDIIHYHRQLMPDIRQLKLMKSKITESGTKLVVDLDDYWKLHKDHPYYYRSVESKTHIPIMENLKTADYVTTTTDLFAEEIRKVTGKDNVGVFFNSINPEWMKQFQDNWKPDPDGKVRITYMAGSSHWGDIQQLHGVFNVLYNDQQLKDKFKIILGGWDADGTKTEINFNEEFKTDLEKLNLWNAQNVKLVNVTKGDVDRLNFLSNDLKEKYRDNIFITKERPLESKESIYFNYENILTDKHSIIHDEEYKQWLMNFERNIKYPNENVFARRWTQKANIYATTLDETDIVIAPLADNSFNRMKSNLKQVECWTRKLPIVCNDIPPYNVHGRHMENCMLVPNKSNVRKYWQKYLKKLILDADLRKQLGGQLYEDFKVEYNLKFVTKKRADFYKSIVNK